MMILPLEFGSLDALLRYCSMFVPFVEVGTLVRYLPESKSGQHLMMWVACVLYTIDGRIGGIK
jgi:hypothetical protein